MNIDYWLKLRKRMLPRLKERGSKSRFAEKMGVPRQTVHKWLYCGLVPNYNVGKKIERWIG